LLLPHSLGQCVPRKRSCSSRPRYQRTSLTDPTWDQRPLASKEPSWSRTEICAVAMGRPRAGDERCVETPAESSRKTLREAWSDGTHRRAPGTLDWMADQRGAPRSRVDHVLLVSIQTEEMPRKSQGVPAVIVSGVGGSSFMHDGCEEVVAHPDPRSARRMRVSRMLMLREGAPPNDRRSAAGTSPAARTRALRGE
jgi:hypothetical protein